MTAVDNQASATPAPAEASGRRIQPLAVVAFLIFFGPALAGLCGVKAKATENRPLRSFPAVSSGWDFLPNFDGWAIDHTPLRDKMVRTNDEVSEQLFNEISPAAPAAKSLLKGDGSWLFFRGDARLSCNPDARFQSQFDGADQLGALLTSRGLRYVFVAVPDKSTIETSHLPDSYPYKTCGETNDRHFWERLRTNPPTGNLDLHGPLQNLRQRTGRAYWDTDTHWLPEGAAEYGMQLARRLNPAVANASTIVQEGTESRTTDLSSMRGRSDLRSAPDWRVKDAGDMARTTTSFGNMPLITVRNDHTARPLIAGRTLILGDSFTANSLNQVVPYFAEVSYLHWQAAVVNYAETAKLLAGYSTVIVAVVERGLASGGVSLFYPTAIGNLAAAMPPV